MHAVCCSSGGMRTAAIALCILQLGWPARLPTPLVSFHDPPPPPVHGWHALTRGWRVQAVDPRIMDVKRRVRAARRKLKRESKVSLSDEVVFFDDVAGNEQAKTELREVVDFFRAPEKFRSSGARAPKGVLLVGPPGNGKTLMARQAASRPRAVRCLVWCACHAHRWATAMWSVRPGQARPPAG